MNNDENSFGKNAGEFSEAFLINHVNQFGDALVIDHSQQDMNNHAFGATPQWQQNGYVFGATSQPNYPQNLFSTCGATMPAAAPGFQQHINQMTDGMQPDSNDSNDMHDENMMVLDEQTQMRRKIVYIKFYAYGIIFKL